jgi:glycosyltransferase involved in cell wall biosynthesis
VRLAIALEYRFNRHTDGSVWTSSAYGRAYWERYLSCFDRVLIVARAKPVDAVDPGWVRVDDARVEVARLPYYIGPWRYLRAHRSLRRAISDVVRRDDALILRVPGAIGTTVLAAVDKVRKPYGLEVVGDPADSLGPGAVKMAFRPVLRAWGVRSLARQCRDAAAVLYVTQRTLQNRYPPGAAAATLGVSDVTLRDDDLALSGRRVFVASNVELTPDALAREPPKPRQVIRKLVCVAALDQPYKGLDVLLASVARCRDRGVEFDLTVAGDGRERPRLEALVQKLRLEDRVHFLGFLPAGSAVRAVLDEADVFVLPSRVDSMPRALLEAMARGLPCVATRVGGIPEVLPPEALVRAGDPLELADRLVFLATRPDILYAWGQRNHEKALEFREDILQVSRERFYRAVREANENWLSHTA